MMKRKQNRFRATGFYLFISILCLLIFTSSCTLIPRKDDTIIEVNGERVSVGEYQALYESLKPREVGRPPREAAEIKNLVLKTLVRRHVITTEAKRRGLKVLEEEVEKELKAISNGSDYQTLKEQLLEERLDEQSWREQIKENLLMLKLFTQTDVIKQKPKLSDALAFYQNNPRLFQKNARATALHIVVSDKALADELKKKLTSNPRAFVDLARQFSTGPEAKENAQIEVEKGTLPDSLDQALFAGPMGKIQGVIESPYGFHLLRVVERRPSINRDFDQVKDQILKMIEQDQIRQAQHRFEEELIRGALVQYNRDLIKKL